MNNQRGSALINVMAVVAMLLIVGFALMQAINSDALLSVRDADVTHSMQMAEGGIDFGIEMLMAGPEQALGVGLQWPPVGAGTPFVINVEEGQVEVTIEEIEADKRYLVTSKAFREAAIRVLQAEITQYTTGDPFPYSLYVGGQVSDPTAEYDLVLDNLAFNGSVYLAANRVYIGPNVDFEGDVHFAGSSVYICKQASFDLTRAKATREPSTVITTDATSESHWTRFIDPVSSLYTMPDIPISEYATSSDFRNWGNCGTILYSGLEQYNYFEGDIDIQLQKGEHPDFTKMVIVCGKDADGNGGSVNFSNYDGSSFQYQPAQDTVVIIMADASITGVEKITTKGNGPIVNFYLYAKESITTEQNVYLSSVIAQVVTFHNQKNVIQAPDPRVFDELPPMVKEDWGIKGFSVTKWTN